MIGAPQSFDVPFEDNYLKTEDDKDWVREFFNLDWKAVSWLLW